MYGVLSNESYPLLGIETQLLVGCPPSHYRAVTVGAFIFVYRSNDFARRFWNTDHVTRNDYDDDDKQERCYPGDDDDERRREVEGTAHRLKDVLLILFGQQTTPARLHINAIEPHTKTSHMFGGDFKLVSGGKRVSSW